MSRKQMIYSRFAVIFAVSVLCLGTTAFGAGTVLFDDGFESNTSYSTVAWPDLSGDFDPVAPAVGSWQVNETNEVQVQVSHYTNSGDANIPNTIHGGTRYLNSGTHHEYYGEGTHAGMPRAIFLPYTDVSVDFWIYCHDGMDSRFVGYAADGTGVFYIRLYSDPEFGPQTDYYSGAAWTPVPNTTWTAGIWNHLTVDISFTTGSISLTNASGGYPGTGSIYWYELDEALNPLATNISAVMFDGEETSYYDDIKVTAVLDPVVLTMVANPTAANTGTAPIAGTTYNVPIGMAVPVIARDYIGIGGTYYSFVKWQVDGSDYSTDLSTTVTMDAAKTVTAVFSTPTAIPLLDDNFDTSTTVSTVKWPGDSGDFDPDMATAGGWYINEPDARNVQVSSYTSSVDANVPTAAHSGSNYLNAGYHYNYYGNWNHKGHAEALFPAVPKAVFDFWVYLADDQGPNLEFGMAVYDIPDPVAGLTALYLRAQASGVLEYYSAGWTTAVAAMTPHAWNHVVLVASVVDHVATLEVNGGSPEVIGWYDNTVTQLGSALWTGDYEGYFDDIKITTHGPSANLTIAADHGVTSTVPAPGVHAYPVDANVTVIANRYVNCPDVYDFDSWTGDVNNPAAATTTIIMTTSKSITANYTDDRVCGDECHQHPVGDMNQNCKVDFADFALFAEQWALCTQPTGTACN